MNLIEKGKGQKRPSESMAERGAHCKKPMRRDAAIQPESGQTEKSYEAKWYLYSALKRSRRDRDKKIRALEKTKEIKSMMQKHSENSQAKNWLFNCKYEKRIDFSD